MLNYYIDLLTKINRKQNKETNQVVKTGKLIWFN